MTKKLLMTIFIVISPLLIYVACWWYTYSNLKNPMDEMLYSETNEINLMTYPRLSRIIGSRVAYKSDQIFVTLDYSDKFLENNEELYVYVGSSTLDYKYVIKLEENVDLWISFTYKQDNNLKESILGQDDMTLFTSDRTYEQSDIISYLSIYGKDKAWLRQQSEKVVENYILGTWFKYGSDRYSLDDLGDLRIDYSKMASE